ncbi:hypothetical protein Gogos_021105, partial [Gossypium gossypioides]|nr:hypothetical protein [Gossypium gossypioides]
RLSIRVLCIRDQGVTPCSCSNLSGNGVYLNTDGSVRPEDGFATIGGIESPTGGSNLALIKRILQLLSRIQHWSMCHILREENQETNRLAKLAHMNSQGLQ